MKNGFAKEIYEENNNVLFNIIAVSEIVNKYNFRNTYHCTYTLERTFTTIKILYDSPEKIDICIYYKIEIDPNKKGLFPELMSLNEKYGLNFGIREVDNKVFCNYTVYCRPKKLSEDAFSAVFERHVNNADAHEDEIIQTLTPFGISFADKELPPFNVEDFAKFLERRLSEENCGQFIREYEDEIFELSELDSNSSYDDYDEEEHYVFKDDEEDE